MNAPEIPPQPNPPARVIIPTTSQRDILIGVILAVLVLGFVVFAVIQTGKPQKTNMLKGEIIEKIHTGIKEQEITLGFKKGKLDRQTLDTGYQFKVKVKDMPEPYVVPVSKDVWEAKKPGDRMEFMRPKSQRVY